MFALKFLLQREVIILVDAGNFEFRNVRFNALSPSFPRPATTEPVNLQWV